MANRKRVKAGDLIKVPFNEGMHTYARVLIEESYAFYDCASITDVDDYDTIIKSDILFIASVDVFAVSEGHWTIVKNIPLEDELKNYYPRYFNTSPTNQTNLGFYQIYTKEIEQAIAKDWIKTGKIQLDAIYSNVHIEQRLRDYYSGKRNEENTWQMWNFKKGFWLTTLTIDDFRDELNQLPTTSAL